MSDDQTTPVRTVTVELLRKGPPHNQLLSPLTEYLGICGDAGAGSVTVPYEQAAFNVLLEDLRYVDSDEEDQGPRQRAVRTLGQAVGEVLGSVPGFTGSLSAGSGSGELTNLRIVTSAQELSLIPFELAKVPSATGRPSNATLALQASTPVCITRRSRSVSTTDATWRSEARPRVLFIVGLDIDEELAKLHRDALMDALAPWDTFRIDDHTYSEHCVVELSPFRDNELPTVQAIREQLQTGFTYVHILAHGAEAEEAEGLTYGVYLPGVDPDDRTPSADIADVVTGERFATILSSIDRELWPSVIVAAACDGANQGGVMVPGGSFGHALHELGVPLVVASQFPLTTEGSVTLTRLFYEDVAWGAEPLPVLARVRAVLHSEQALTHDWASIVVYDGLPDDLSAHCVRARYTRGKRALQRAQDVIRRGGTKAETRQQTRIADGEALAKRAVQVVPRDNGYDCEREGLLGSHAKLLASIEYERAMRMLADRAEDDWSTPRGFKKARAYLEQARRHYHRAGRTFLDPDNDKQLEATLHWVLTQSISLDRLMGDSISDDGWGQDRVDAFGVTPEEQAWALAYQSATIGSEGSDPVWGHGTLTELWLLKLFEELEQPGIDRAIELAQHHALQIARLSSASDPFPVYSTKRQLNRYATLWTPEFRYNLQLTPDDTSYWPRVRDQASVLVELLDRHQSADVES